MQETEMQEEMQEEIQDMHEAEMRGDEDACLGTPHCCNAAGRPRSAELEARLQNLLETAARLFIEKGYTKVSLEMIAREAHVAVRTIYVKFGGKAGLFNAVLATGRERFFTNISDMVTDPRPVREILGDFGMRFLALVSAPVSLKLQRMVIAEALGSPELARTFFDSGPAQTRELLVRFFARPDIRAQLREDVHLEYLPVHLINCIMGDTTALFLFEPAPAQSDEEIRQALEQRLEFFYQGVLRQA